MKINRCCVCAYSHFCCAMAERCCVTMRSSLGSSVFLRCPARVISMRMLVAYSIFKVARRVMSSDVHRWTVARQDDGYWRAKTAWKLHAARKRWPLLQPWHQRREQERERERPTNLDLCASSPSEIFFTRALRNNWVRGISSRRLFIFTDLMMGGSFYRAKHSFQIPNNWFIPYSIFCAPAALSLRCCCCCVRWWANFLPAACASTQIPACIFHHTHTQTRCQLLIMGPFTQIYCGFFRWCFGLLNLIMTKDLSHFLILFMSFKASNSMIILVMFFLQNYIDFNIFA